MSGQLTEAFQDQLEQWIGTGPRKFDLLYAITRDGCSNKAFHQKCDNKGPTVTVLYNRYGSVYGGYTGCSWSQANKYVHDATAFLFRLQYNGNTSSNKFPCKQAQQSVFCNANYGPTFGGNHDLHTFTGSIYSPEEYNEICCYDEPIQTDYDGTPNFIELKNSTRGYFQLNGRLNLGCTFDPQGVSNNQINNGTMNVTELEVYTVSAGKRKPDKPKPSASDKPKPSASDKLNPSASAKPWRETPEWDIELLEGLKSEVEHFTPPSVVKVPQSRILLIGPVGAGKSSFFNTISSIFKGRITVQAPCGSAEHSLTSQYRMYQVRNPTSGQVMKFRLCDTRGLEDGQGIDANDIAYLLDGNLPDGFQFNPSVPIGPEIPGFKKKTTLKDKVHCVCIVIDGSTGGVLPDKIVEQIKSIQSKINMRGIPQLVLLTKVDKICREVDADISQVFKSKAVLEQVHKVSQLLGLPENQILPTKNYMTEIELKEYVSILALLTIRQILRASEDYMENFLDDTHCDADEASVLAMRKYLRIHYEHGVSSLATRVCCLDIGSATYLSVARL